MHIRWKEHHYALNNNQKCQASYVSTMLRPEAQQWVRFCPFVMHLSRVSWLVRKLHCSAGERWAKWSSQDGRRAVSYSPGAQPLLLNRSYREYAATATPHHLPVSSTCLLNDAPIVSHFLQRQPTCNNISRLFTAQSWTTGGGVRVYDKAACVSWPLWRERNGIKRL